MEFTNHFYVEVKERSTDLSALEVLIDRHTGVVHPEPGPNMMCNTKYGHISGWGHMGGMMGSYSFKEPAAQMSISSNRAKVYAQEFLDNSMPEVTVIDEVDTFYGYYTIHTVRDGQVYGMLSVNGYTGRSGTITGMVSFCL